MAKKRRYRWVCPECGAGKLLGKRPRKNKTARYCLSCSEETGYLVERTCPVLDRQRKKKKEARAARAARKAEKDRERYLINDGGDDPFDLMKEFQRLQRYKPFRRRDWSRWKLKVRNCSRPQRQHGFCDVSKRVIHISVWLGLDRTDLMQTLLHEMVHAVVRGQRKGPRWHGDKFRSTLDETARKVFDIPQGHTLPTYAGTCWDLDAAITKFLQDSDPEFEARHKSVIQRRKKLAKPKPPKNGGEKWVLEPLGNGGVAIRITPGAHDAFYHGFCDWVSGEEDPEEEPKALLASAIHNADRLPGRQGYLATLEVNEGLGKHLMRLANECDGLTSLSSVSSRRSEVAGLARIRHAIEMWQKGKLWSPRRARFSTRWGAEWTGGITTPMEDSA